MQIDISLSDRIERDEVLSTGNSRAKAAAPSQARIRPEPCTQTWRRSP